MSIGKKIINLFFADNKKANILYLKTLELTQI